MSAVDSSSAELPDELAHHIVHVAHTTWQLQDRSFRTRLLEADADEQLGRLLLTHLESHAHIALREPVDVPTGRMFHALAWLAQVGHHLEERERLEQTEFQRRNNLHTHRRQWRIAPCPDLANAVQVSLF